MLERTAKMADAVSICLIPFPVLSLPLEAGNLLKIRETKRFENMGSSYRVDAHFLSRTTLKNV